MIALVEGAERQKTPNEIALTILLAGLTLIFSVAVATLPSLRAPTPAARSAIVVLVGAARDADPDHDRRAALGHRHRRHGPAGALQRARDVGPRGRGGRRRRHAAARQDRHHHLRQPHGDRVHAGARRHRGGARRRRAARLARRRDAGGPLDRGARQGEARPARARHGRARRDLRALHRPDPDERRRLSAAAPSARARSTRCSPRRVRCRPAARWRRRTVGGAARGGARGQALPSDRKAGGTPLAVADGRPAARRRPPQGHRQGRHPRALRRAARAWASAR